MDHNKEQVRALLKYELTPEMLWIRRSILNFKKMKNLFQLLVFNCVNITQSKYLIIVLTGLVLFSSCHNDSDDPSINNLGTDIPTLYDSDLTYLHDYYVDILCDSIHFWRDNNVDKEQAISNTLNHIIIQKSALSLGVSQDSVRYLLSVIGISDVETFKTWNDYVESNIPSEYDQFVDDILVMYDEQFSDDQEILDELDYIRSQYILNSSLNSEVVDYSIDVAKSSLTYWNNTESMYCIYGDNWSNMRCDKCPKAIAAADVLGAIMGAATAAAASAGTGTLVGAMLGAEAGTLSAGILAAVFS